MEQAQERADSPGAAAGAADYAGVYNPAVKKRGNAREQSLGGFDQPIVKVVDVESVSQKIDIERVARATSIKPNRQTGAEQHRNEGEHRNDEEKFFLTWNDKKVLREKWGAAKKREQSE